MTEALLKLSTTARLMMSKAGVSRGDEFVKTVTAPFEQELIEVFRSLDERDAWDAFADSILDLIQRGGTDFAQKVVDDADAIVKETPRQHSDLAIVAVSLGSLTLIGAAIGVCAILALRVGTVRGNPDGSWEASFNDMPSNSVEVLKQILPKTSAVDFLVRELTDGQDESATEL